MMQVLLSKSVYKERGERAVVLTENDPLHEYCKALSFNVWSVNRTVGISSHLTRSVYSTLEPGKRLWLFLQAEFWCLGVWAMDQQDVPAGREWSAHSQLARLGAMATVNCQDLLMFLLKLTRTTQAFCPCLRMPVRLLRSAPSSSGRNV